MRSKLLALLTIATMGMLHADRCAPDPCCNKFTDGFSVYGDYLFWKPTIGHLDYAVPYNTTGTTTAIGRAKSICPDFESGFRVGLSKSCDCWVFGVDYTRLSFNEGNSITDAVNGDLAGTLLLDTFTSLSQGSIQYAKSSIDLDYNYLRATVGYDCCSCGCLDIDLYTGFTYAQLDLTRKTLYSETTNLTGSSNNVERVRQNSDFQAYGVNFGFVPTYTFCDCIDLFGAFSVDAVLGDLDRSFRYTSSADGEATTTELVNLKTGCWTLANQLNLATGITYRFGNTCGCNFALSVGYEFHQWFNIPGLLTFQDESGEVTFDRFNADLGFNGLFVRLAAGF